MCAQVRSRRSGYRGVAVAAGGDEPPGVAGNAVEVEFGKITDAAVRGAGLLGSFVA